MSNVSKVTIRTRIPDQVNQSTDTPNLQAKIDKLEKTLIEVIEAFNKFEAEVNEEKRIGTWKWKEGKLDADGKWVRGKWV